MSTNRPAIAAAAAMAGETRWVRPLKPWRPSKLRFEVEAQRSPRLSRSVVHGEAHRAARLAPFEAGGEEDLVEALGLGLLLHQARARHDHGVDALVHVSCRRRSCAAARRSSMRPLVQEPRKTRSIVMSLIFVSRRQAHIGERPLDRALRLSGSAISAGSGTLPSMVITFSGLVPQVTSGGSLAASSFTSRSKPAPSSE